MQSVFNRRISDVSRYGLFAGLLYFDVNPDTGLCSFRNQELFNQEFEITIFQTGATNPDDRSGFR
jgi:hypothetical protein